MNLNLVGSILLAVLFLALGAIIFLKRAMFYSRRGNAPAAAGGMPLGILHLAAVATPAAVPVGGASVAGAPAGSGAGAGAGAPAGVAAAV